MRNTNKKIIKSLKSSLIASCQPVAKGPMDKPSIILALAKASIKGGAKGLRIEGYKNLKLIKSKLKVPVIGIKKHITKKYPIIITPFLSDIDKIANLGAEIIAFDATFRERPSSVKKIISRIHFHKKIALADCSTFQEAYAAVNDGADIVATTLSGYTNNKKIPKLPDFKLIKKCKKLKIPVIAEGRYNNAKLFSKAIRYGAHAVVVGTALNRIEIITRSFVNEV